MGAAARACAALSFHRLIHRRSAEWRRAFAHAAVRSSAADSGMESMLKIILATSFAIVAAGAALAHVTLETTEAPVGAAYKAVLRVPHGCEGEATQKVRVQIPEGVIAVKPMPKAGWTLETVTGKYARSYDYFGSPMNEGVTEVIWTGELPDAFYDEFVFRGMLTTSLEPGTHLYIPVVQECADGAERWIEIPAAGQDPDSLEYPAPGLKLLPAAGGH
jgi:uncharacterized protein YcnI